METYHGVKVFIHAKSLFLIIILMVQVRYKTGLMHVQNVMTHICLQRPKPFHSLCTSNIVRKEKKSWASALSSCFPTMFSTFEIQI